MTTASCPGCHRPVHPLLGDVPLVLGDRVVMCCSEACRDRTLAGLAPPVAPPQAPGVESGDAPVEPALSAPVPPGAPSDLPSAAGVEGAVSAVALERPPLAASRRRRVLVSTLVGGGALLVVFAGYLILAYAYGGGVGTNGASLSDSVGRLRPAPRMEDAAPPPRPSAPPPPRAERRPSLMTLRKRSWHMLEGFLASRTGRFWRTSARVLAEQGHAGALEVLRQALKSASWPNRQRAAEALARMGHAEGLAVLKQDLVAPRRPVQHASAFALARCGDPAGLRVLRQLARYRQHRMTAYEALVRLGDRLGLSQLQEVLQKSRAPYDRLRAAVALGMHGDQAGLPVLRERMKEPGMHMGVALALQKLGAPQARDALVRALDHTALRVEAARALRAYGDVTLVAKMSPELGSGSEDSRLTAAAAIVILTSEARAEAR